MSLWSNRQRLLSIAVRASTDADQRTGRIGLLGFGRIGQAVASLCSRDHADLASSGLELTCDAALVRSVDRERSGHEHVTLVTDGLALIASGVDVIVEVLGGVEPARTLVAEALTRGIPVVTANKSLMAAHGPELRAIADRAGVTLLFDAAVLAGVPCLGQLARRPLVSSARGIAGVLNGTSSFVLHEIERGATFAAALAEAQARGYAEPDSRADVSGRDAAEKLTILLHLAGCGHASTPEITTLGIDAIAASDFACAAALGGTIAPVAIAQLGQSDEQGAWVGPAFVAHEHPFAHLQGVTNALKFSGAHGRETLFVGPGAGPDVTAATIVDDVVEALTTLVPASPLRANAARADVALSQPPVSSWFVRIDGARFGAAHVAEFLAASHVPALHVASVNGVIAVRTIRASWTAIRHAVSAFESCGAGVLVLPIVETEARA